jgi:Helitron helicase-like domain at N-terminus
MKLVSENASAGAILFDIMMKCFIQKMLRYNDSRPGVFGNCNVFYRMVEVQGRGTLHCHMLIWITCGLSPQKLRDKMAEDELFKTDLFHWLESVIKCELPSNKVPILPRTNARPNSESGINPCSYDAPQIPDDMLSPEGKLFQIHFENFVEQLAVTCNWHVHQSTCWKHLKEGEPKDDAHCRMCMKGEMHALTELDEETMSILLQRLHLWINNFNDVVIFLLKCNMDVKFIGSSMAAKALVLHYGLHYEVFAAYSPRFDCC